MQASPNGGRPSESLRVPGGPLAHLAQAHAFPEEVDQSLRVIAHHHGNLSERRGPIRLMPVEGLSQLPEQPGTPEAPTADDDGVTAGLAHHLQGVPALPDVPIAEHGNGQGLLHRGDGLPVGVPCVELLRRPPVESHGGHALVLGRQRCSGPGDQVVSQPLAHLDRHGHFARRVHHGPDESRNEPGLERDRGAASGAGDLGDGASQVEVHVIDALVHQHPHHLAEVHRVRSIDLHRSRALVWMTAGQ